MTPLGSSTLGIDLGDRTQGRAQPIYGLRDLFSDPDTEKVRDRIRTELQGSEALEHLAYREEDIGAAMIQLKGGSSPDDVTEEFVRRNLGSMLRDHMRSPDGLAVTVLEFLGAENPLRDVMREKLQRHYSGVVQTAKAMQDPDASYLFDRLT